MTNGKGPPPAPLHPRVARKLLDLLSTDDDFRDLFRRDAHAALVQAGYEAPAGTESTAGASGGGCMQLSGTDQLASKEQIARDRPKLEQSLSMVQSFTGISGFKSD